MPARNYDLKWEEFIHVLKRFFVVVLIASVAAACCALQTFQVRRTCIRDSKCEAMGSMHSFITNRENRFASGILDIPNVLNNYTQTLAPWGVCSPGYRTQRVYGTSQMECVPFFSFPDGSDKEIMDPNAETPHMRACGKWIRSGLPVDRVVTRSREQHSSWVRALRNAEDEATKYTSTATTQMAKFRMECMRTVHHGRSGVRHAALSAYRYLIDGLGDLRSSSDVLKATGFLSSHLCETSVMIGTSITMNGAFMVHLREGHVFSAGVLAKALEFLDETESIQRQAERANTNTNGVVNVYGSRKLTDSEIMEIIEGAVNVKQGLSPSRIYVNQTHTLQRIVSHFENGATDDVKSMLRGTAAFCVCTLASRVDSHIHTIELEIEKIQRARPRATEFGRLHSSSEEVHVTNETLLNASTVTAAQMWRRSTPDEDSDCLDFMRAVFPDDVDKARFSATVNGRLYERIQQMTDIVKKSLQTIIYLPPMKDMLFDVDLVSDKIATSTLRIAGAPRGTWAGVSHPTSASGIRSDDGIVLMALRSARATFTDRIVNLVVKNADACDHPTFLSSETANAYVIPIFTCAVLLLGMAHRPWLDGQYDDATLASRGMAIIAHELAHLTLNTPYTARFDEFFTVYQKSTRVEAIADAGAVLALSKTGLVNSSTLMSNFCQLWCARMPQNFMTSMTDTHPAPNDRCDLLYQILSNFIF